MKAAQWRRQWIGRPRGYSFVAAAIKQREVVSVLSYHTDVLVISVKMISIAVIPLVNMKRQDVRIWRMSRSLKIVCEKLLHNNRSRLNYGGRGRGISYNRCVFWPSEMGTVIAVLNLS